MPLGATDRTYNPLGYTARPLIKVMLGMSLDTEGVKLMGWKSWIQPPRWVYKLLYTGYAYVTVTQNHTVPICSKPWLLLNDLLGQRYPH